MKLHFAPQAFDDIETALARWQRNREKAPQLLEATPHAGVEVHVRGQVLRRQRAKSSSLVSGIAAEVARPGSEE